MKIISYNVNGIRSALNKGLLKFMQEQSADVYCFQEIKASPEMLDLYMFEVAGYPYCYWHPAEKKGYSGVAIVCRKKPEKVEIGFGDPAYDSEGRIIRAQFGDLVIASLYIPSGSSGELRQSYKMNWLGFFMDYATRLKYAYPELLICGDFNICHHAIDIHDPVGNKNRSGFLPEERDWMSRFLEAGFIDSFRRFNQSPHQYSWWSQRTHARARNKGWRLDYCMASTGLRDKLKYAGILQQAVHSDHCPVWVELDFACLPGRQGFEKRSRY